jgi:hypothetical protein
MVGSAHEFIRDGQNGFMYPAARPDALRRILELLAGEPGLIDRLRSSIVPPPRIEEEAFQVESIYRSLVGRLPAS